MEPLVKCYTLESQTYGFHVKVRNILRQIDQNELEYFDNREGCYAPPAFLTPFVESIEKQFKVENSTWEIFYPKVNYPMHVDSHGDSLAIPLETGNTLQVDDLFLSNLQCLTVYRFNDKIPHLSTGAFLMVNLGGSV